MVSYSAFFRTMHVYSIITQQHQKQLQYNSTTRWMQCCLSCPVDYSSWKSCEINISLYVDVFFFVKVHRKRLLDTLMRCNVCSIVRCLCSLYLVSGVWRRGNRFGFFRLLSLKCLCRFSPPAPRNRARARGDFWWTNERRPTAERCRRQEEKSRCFGVHLLRDRKLARWWRVHKWPRSAR